MNDFRTFLAEKPGLKILELEVVYSGSEFFDHMGISGSQASGEIPRSSSITQSSANQTCQKMLDRGEETTGSLAALFEVDRTTIWRALRQL